MKPVVLTYAEGRAVVTRVDEDLSDAMLEVRKHCWERSHVYELPAIAWKRALDRLREVGYGQRGGRAVNSESFYTAVAKITEAVVDFELHPAFRDLAVVGVATEIIPAFEVGEERWSPYPSGRFGLLCPEHLVRYGRTLTVWREGSWPSAESPLHREEFHRQFAVT